MFKYFSYYNVGGYKDMYLGDSSMTEAQSYFFPLMAIWRKNAKAGDKTCAERVEALEKLPSIKIVTNDENRGLPESAKTLFSHGGYKLILTKANTDEYIFAIRDIDGDAKDDAGRSTPFLLVVVGNSDEEKLQLEKIATYAASHLETFSKKISVLFKYDAEKNGVSFDIASLTTYLNKISKESDNSLLTLDGEVIVDGSHKDTPLLVLPEGIDKNIATTEQKLSRKEVNFVGVDNLIPLDNHKKLVALIKGSVGTKSSLLSNWKVSCLFGSAAIVGFIIGYIIGKQ